MLVQEKMAMIYFLDSLRETLAKRDTCKNKTHLLAFTRKSTESHKTKIKLESH